MRSMCVTVSATAVLAALACSSAAAHPVGDGWSTAVKIDEIPGNSPDINGPAMDGCPIQSPDGRSLYFASNREGSRGLDIWVSHRRGRHAGWGPPENLGEPVNSAADDFCPTPTRGGGLFFVSREALPGACGLGDIYFTRYTRRHGWREPVHLACAPSGPNSALDEQGPSYVKGSLYFSSSTLPPATSGEIFVSPGHPGRGFGPATPVAELNDPAANDIQPNVRSDGLEVVFSSTRAGTPDIWVAARRSLRQRWSAPVALGPEVNTSAGETRPSLSSDGRALLFGRAPGPEGQSDIYLATRARR